jgi:hypothetical protein
MKTESAAEKLFSFFLAPVTNVVPSRVINLDEVHRILVSDELKSQTEQVRANPSLKIRILPFVTFSGTFNKRNFAGLKQYSSCIVIDLDNCNMALKEVIAGDKQFPPSLLFTSPLGLGLKIVYSIANASVERHFEYFRSLSFYLSEIHNVIPDKSGSDITRICLIPRDIDCYYSPLASIDSSKLLEYFPPDKTAPPNVTATSAPVFGTSTTSTGERPSDFLNKLDAVYRRALKDLVELDGWTLHTDGIHLTREGKKGGNSAIFNYYPAYGFPVMTNYSSSAKSFGVKGWAPVQIICRLEFNNDWNECITHLVNEYL